MSNRIFLPIVALAATCASVFAGDDREDLRLLKDRLVASCLEGEREPAPAIEALIGALGEDGRWEDVDYEDLSRSGWRTFEHLNRTLRLSRALRHPRHPLFEDAGLRRATLRALDAWLEAGFVNPNWWWNRIGVPRTLYRIRWRAARPGVLSRRPLQRWIDAQPAALERESVGAGPTVKEDAELVGLNLARGECESARSRGAGHAREGYRRGAARRGRLREVVRPVVRFGRGRVHHAGCLFWFKDSFSRAAMSLGRAA